MTEIIGKRDTFRRRLLLLHNTLRDIIEVRVGRRSDRRRLGIGDGDNFFHWRKRSWKTGVSDLSPVFFLRRPVYLYVCRDGSRARKGSIGVILLFCPRFPVALSSFVYLGLLFVEDVIFWNRWALQLERFFINYFKKYETETC